MKSWFLSSSGILTVASIAFLSFVGYIFLSALVLGTWGLKTTMITLSVLVVVALASTWLWALLSISRGGRGALIVVLVLGFLNILAGASDILVFCPTPCQGYWPLAEIWHWIMVFSGLAAIIPIGIKLKNSHR